MYAQLWFNQKMNSAVQFSGTKVNYYEDWIKALQNMNILDWVKYIFDLKLHTSNIKNIVKVKVVFKKIENKLKPKNRRIKIF